LSSAFQEINFTNDFYIKKGLQKINRQLNLILSYPLSDASKIELSIHFLMEFNRFVGRKKNHTVIYNIYLRVLAKLEKWVAKLHEDLQFDFEEKLNELRR
jgi:hypothetical protein